MAIDLNVQAWFEEQVAAQEQGGVAGKQGPSGVRPGALLTLLPSRRSQRER